MPQLGLKEPVMKCAIFPYWPFSSNLQQLVTPKNCCEIRLLKLNTPNLQKDNHTCMKLNYKKINTLYRKDKQTVCSKINQSCEEKQPHLPEGNNKNLGQPTKVDAAGCYTMGIPSWIRLCVLMFPLHLFVYCKKKILSTWTSQSRKIEMSKIPAYLGATPRQRRQNVGQN